MFDCDSDDVRRCGGQCHDSQRRGQVEIDAPSGKEHEGDGHEAHLDLWRNACRARVTGFYL